MGFWIAAGGMGLAVTALLLLALLRGRSGDTPAAAYDLRVYRDQLREVDRDLARGVIGSSDADRLRTEISRRVLDADRALQDGTADPAAPRGATLAMAVLVLAICVGAVWGYLRLGAPGYPDLPIKARIAMAEELHRTRPDQATAEAEAQASAPAAAAPDPEYLALMEKLRAAVASRPDDLTGQELLARNEAALGNFAAARSAMTRVMELKGAAAGAEDHAGLAELQILAAGSYVSPEAEAELVRALQLDPTNPTATYYAGLMFLQTGRPDRAFNLWAPLLDRSHPDDPWYPPLMAQMERVAELAGAQNYSLPAAAALPGPSAADMAAAEDMSPEDRQQMIRDMVAQLNDRLATQGGTAEEWARLIGAYGVLAEADRAREIWAEAQTRFAGRPDDLAVIRAAATRAGIAE